MITLPITLGDYMTENKEHATVEEVCSVAIFGRIGEAKTIWNVWGESRHDCDRLVARLPKCKDKRKNDEISLQHLALD